MLRFKTKQLEISAGRLGFTAEALQRCLQAPTLEQAKTNLDNLRKAVKRSYREKSLELHPDRNNGDVEKAEQFKDLSLAYSEIDAFLERVNLRPVQPRPAVRVVVYNGNTTSTCTSTTFTSNWWTRTQ